METPMSPSGKSPRRIVMTVVACAVLLIVAAATALGQTGSSREPSGPAAEGPTGAGASGVTSSGTASNASGIGPVAEITTTAEGSSIASTAWCCTTGSVPGLTVMGQATIKGQGSAARDAAIAEAVAKLKQKQLSLPANEARQLQRDVARRGLKRLLG